MPLFMDRHDWPEETRTTADVDARHQRDLDVQDKYGVRYITGLIDLEGHRTFCIVEGPSKEACEAVHREAHGATAGKIIEIDHDILAEFFGQLQGMSTGDIMYGGALRTILFTDIVDSTALYQRLGDAVARRVCREHDEIVTAAITATGGREVKHTGDGIMACFASVARAIECGARIQRAIAERAEQTEWPIRVRVGLSAGEPVADGDDLFGTVVNLARRICDAAEPGAVMVSTPVRDLSLGKGFTWTDAGRVELKGFDEPVQLFELDLG